MTTDKKYTLIAYKPSSRSWRGCHCHGSDEFFDSDIQVEQDLTEEELKKSLTHYAARDLDKGEDGYEFLIFEGGKLALSKGENIQATPYDATEDESRYGDEDLEDLKKERAERDERMQRIFAESAAKTRDEMAARAKAEAERKEAERKVQVERERKAQEDRERRQLAELQAKYGSKP
jgi:hypothetical protein